MGKSTINGVFSRAMLVYQRVAPCNRTLQRPKLSGSGQRKFPIREDDASWRVRWTTWLRCSSLSLWPLINLGDNGYKYNPKHSYMFIHISKNNLVWCFFRLLFHISHHTKLYIPIPSYYSDIWYSHIPSNIPVYILTMFLFWCHLQLFFAQVDHLPSGQDGACALRSIGICGGSEVPGEVPGELFFAK